MLWLIAVCPYGAEECVLSFEQRVEVREYASLRVREGAGGQRYGEFLTTHRRKDHDDIPDDSLKYEAYTGDYRVEVKDSEARFSTTRPLKNGIFVLFLTLVVVSLYYLRVWAPMCRRSPVKAVVPEFRPPEGMSPAAVRYVYKGRCDSTCFTANLIDMAVKGTLKIKEKKGDYLLEKLPTDEDKLTEDEREMYNALPELWLRSRPRNLMPVVKGLEETLSHTYQYLFKRIHFELGTLLSSIGIGIAIFLVKNFPMLDIARIMSMYFLARSVKSGKIGSISRFAMFLVYLIPFVFALTIFYFTLLMATFILSTNKSSSLYSALILLDWIFIAVAPIIVIFLPDKTKKIVAIMFVGTIILISYVFEPETHYFALIMMLIVELNMSFSKCVNFSKKGQEMINRIIGLKVFLQTTEKERLKALFPKDSLPQIFERFLPYALALDVAETWVNKFAEDLKALRYEPKWYEGPSIRHVYSGRYYRFVRDLTSYGLNELVSQWLT